MRPGAVLSARQGTVVALSLVDMFLVSRSALRLLGSVSLFAACLGATCTRCFAQSFFLPVASTPYDHQMLPVSGVLNSPARPLAGQTSLVTLNQWMTHSIQWKTPAQVSSAAATDCKGKAMILYAKMRANGATHVRFVIGKHYSTDLRTHAWLEWDTTAGTFLLDPTFDSAVRRAEERDSTTYIPLYAYSGAQKYRANYYSPSYAPVVASNEAFPTQRVRSTVIPRATRVRHRR